LKEQLQDQADDFLAEIEALKSLLQKEAKEAGSELSKLEDAKLQLEQQLNAEKKDHSASKLAAAERLEQTMKDAEARRIREIDALQKNLSGDAEEKINALLKKHADEMSSLQESSTKALQDSIDKYEGEKKEAHLEAQKKLKTSLLDLQTKCSEERKAALAAMSSDFTSQISNLNDAHNSAIDGCRGEIDGLNRSLELSTENNNDLQKQLEALHQEKARREEQFVLERDQLLRGHEQDIRVEREKGERAAIEVAQKAANDLQHTKHEFREAMHQQEERIKELEDDLEEMHLRYKNRESRQEDLRMIEELERQMVDKDLLVEKTKEEMMYFKREMLNREESYNTKFNAAPNVGVMNVIKTKDKGGPGKKKEKTARHPVPQNNGMGGMGGMGMGIGGGMGSGPIGVLGGKK
jgi:hypothetical protein